MRLGEIFVVNVQLFPPYSKKVAGENASVEYQEHMTVKDLLMALSRLLPQFPNYFENDTQNPELYHYMVIIVNSQIVDENYVICDGDTIKILSPLTGG